MNGRMKYGIIEENNIISKEEYLDRAKKTLNIVSDALAHSLGYYGSTTIIEDKMAGSVVTKDGYTILKSLGFGIDDSLSNTLLRSIKDISHSLVMEVGDGSTSAVVTSEALFEYLTKENPVLNKLPKKVIVDELKKINKEIEKIIKEEYAKPITEENFEVLKNIASVSNNNDDTSGQLIYDIYKEIGKDGFVFMENSLAEKDHYEVSNGIEISSGYIDPIYANKHNGIESEFHNCSVLMFKGELKAPDMAWLNDMIATYFSHRDRRPLVIVSNGYDLDAINTIKYNKIMNAKSGIDLDMAVTKFNATHDEAYEDLAIYLGGKIIDLNEDEILKEIVKPFNENIHVEKQAFFEEYLGFAKKVYMNSNMSRYMEGGGKKELIDGRVETIDKKIAYYQSIQGSTSAEFEIYRLNKRKANLTSKIVKFYIAGNSNTEIESRKYLLEDAIYASKSALEHGYISGGNLIVSKIINNKLLKEEDISPLRKELLTLVKEAFTRTYVKVLENAGFTEEDIKYTLNECIENESIYNLKTKKYEKDGETTIINSAMTDIRIMESVFSIIGLLVTSNQYVQMAPRRLDLL